jgi:hypothetical protein
MLGQLPAKELVLTGGVLFNKLCYYICRLLENKQSNISALLNCSLSRSSEVFLVCYWYSNDGQSYVSNPYATQFLHCMKPKICTHPSVNQANDDVSLSLSLSLSLSCWGLILDPVEQAAVKFTRSATGSTTWQLFKKVHC